MHPKGNTYPAERAAWHSLKNRCGNPNSSRYSRYGGRGITVCERWFSFENFLADMGPRPSAEHSIDRIDVNGNYEPSNCRWATAAEQSRNTSRNQWLTLNGKTQCLSDWAKEIGITISTLRERMDRDWSNDQILRPPMRVKGRRKTKPVIGRARGERVSKSKLTERLVQEIRDRYAAAPQSFSSLGAEYSVSHETIRSVIRRESWRHLP